MMSGRGWPFLRCRNGGGEEGITVLILKLFAVCGSLAWFFIVFKAMVRLVNAGSAPLATVVAAVMTWLITGMAPAAITRTVWPFVS